MAAGMLRWGTLSFAKHGAAMVLPPVERVRIILDTAWRYQPQLLVTAGYAVDSIRELADLSRQLAILCPQVALVTEVHHESDTEPDEPSRHAMWMVMAKGGKLHRFGEQAFGKAEETRRREGDAIAKLRLQLSHRTVRYRHWDVFGLICGEINIIHGREVTRFACPAIEQAILAADIVINPTHDRMSNAGTLIAKRKLLSRRAADGRDRLYISCSNWDVSGEDRTRQNPSPTLHTAFRSGVPLDYLELADGRDGFVYRRWEYAI